MPLEIRPVQSHAEYRAVEQLQREVWHLDDTEIVPDHLLLTAQKNGGLVLGAFERAAGQAQDRLVGFVFGFLGLTPQGQLKHCSHMTGVAPAWQGRGLGYRLKLAQREHVLFQGVDLITWTFDPLESRNAALNFRKLGVTCGTYLRDLYGSMRDGLNVGLPSDRFEVDWWIASTWVVERLQATAPRSTLSQLQAMGVPVLNPGGPEATDSTDGTEATDSTDDTDDMDEAEGTVKERPAMAAGGRRVLVSVPVDFQAIKATDMALARRWRLHTRELFEALFRQGYRAVDLVGGPGEVCYLLEQVNEPSGSQEGRPT
jgi:predicted GNAT superfamily acetyltransferase